MSDETSVEAFSLLDEPWITCRLVDGSVKDLSLRETFAAADEVIEVAGELATQTFAITRLLLAILSRALGGPITESEWGELWRTGLPVAEIDAYLQTYGDRFDLLHPQTPFFQVAGLHTAKNEVKDVAPLIADLPSNSRLFTNRAGSGAKDLSFAEAARWLVNVQAFDASGIKSGAVGDDRVKGGKGYPIGVAWSGLLGGVMAEGANLRETLLLNLVSPGARLAEYWEGDQPAWERAPDGPAERADTWPLGPVDLGTWQSRRVLLVVDGDRVIGCLVANGDRLTPQNRFQQEMMTAWRYSEPQTKKAGETTYMPLEHRPGRAFWRGIAAILPTGAQQTSAKDHPASLSPGIVDWISRLQEHKLLPGNGMVVLRAIGVLYGSNNAVIDEVLDDRLPVSLALLSTGRRDLAESAVTAVEAAEHGVAAIRNLAANLARASGQTEPDLDGPKRRAEELAYSTLDGAYRSWIRTLTVESDANARLAEWKATARGILRAQGDTLLAAASPAAWAGRERPGRERPGRNGAELYTTSRAASWFALALRNTFGPVPRKETAA